MTPDELLKHPEYHHTIWDLKPDAKGKVSVARTRGGPISIAYEIHGHGPRHMVVSAHTPFSSVIAKFSLARSSFNILLLSLAKKGTHRSSICHA